MAVDIYNYVYPDRVLFANILVCKYAQHIGIAPVFTQWDIVKLNSYTYVCLSVSPDKILQCT